MGNFIPIFDLNWKLLTNRMKVYFKKSSIQNLKKKNLSQKILRASQKDQFLPSPSVKIQIIGGKVYFR